MAVHKAADMAVDKAADMAVHMAAGMAVHKAAGMLASLEAPVHKAVRMMAVAADMQVP